MLLPVRHYLRKSGLTLPRLYAIGLMALFGLAAAQRESLFEPGQHVVVCSVKDMIDDGISVVVERAVQEAETNQAAAIIFKIDTPGGRVDSAIDITESIAESTVPTIAWIRGMGAISAGALISYACEEITMASDTNIGAATPVIMTQQGTMPTDEKSVSFVRAKFRALAEKHGRDPDIAEAMVDPDIELIAYPAEGGGIEISKEQRPGPGGPANRRPSGDDSSVEDEIVKRVVEAIDERVPLPDDVKETTRQMTEEPEALGTAPEAIDEDSIPPEGKVVLAEGKLLTLTPAEAMRWGLIDTTCDRLEEVMSLYGYGGMDTNVIDPTWAEELFRFLTNPTISGLLLLLGIGGLYLEVRTPGFGLPGMIGLGCLSLFFGARVVLGVADWVDLILVFIGIGLLAIEIFVLPGFGVAGVGGLLAIMAGIYMALTRVTIPEYEWDYARLEDAGYTVTLATALLVLFGFLSYYILPRTPFGRAMVLETSLGYDPEISHSEPGARSPKRIGKKGKAITMLRSAGRGRFDDETLDIVSMGQYIEPGTPIEITQVDGNRYVVRPLEAEDA